MKNITKKLYLLALGVILSAQIFGAPLTVMAVTPQDSVNTTSNENATQSDEVTSAENTAETVDNVEPAETKTNEGAKKLVSPVITPMSTNLTQAISLDMSFVFINKNDENDKIAVQSNAAPIVIDSSKYSAYSEFLFNVNNAVSAGEKHTIAFPSELNIKEDVTETTTDGNVKFKLYKGTDGKTYLDIEFLKAVSKGEYKFFYTSAEYILQERLTNFIFTDVNSNTEVGKYAVNFDPTVMKNSTLRTEFGGYSYGNTASKDKPIKWIATTSTKRNGAGQISIEALSGYPDYDYVKSAENIVIKRYNVDLNGNPIGAATTLAQGTDYTLAFDNNTKTETIQFTDVSAAYYYEITYDYAYEVNSAFDYKTYYNRQAYKKITNPDYTVDKQSVTSYVTVGFTNNIFKYSPSYKIINGTTTEITWEIQYNINQFTIPTNQVLNDTMSFIPKGTLSAITVDSVSKNVVTFSNGNQRTVTNIGDGSSDWKLNANNGLEYIGPANNTNYYIFRITTKVDNVATKEFTNYTNKVAETVKSVDDWDQRLTFFTSSTRINNVIIEKTGNVASLDDLYNGIYTWNIDINKQQALADGIPAGTKISDQLSANGGSILKATFAVSYKPFAGTGGTDRTLIEGTDYTITYKNNDHGFDLVFLDEIKDGSINIVYKSQQSDAERTTGMLVENTVSIEFPGDGGEDSVTATVNKNTRLVANAALIAQTRDSSGAFIPGEVKTYMQINISRSDDITKYELNYSFPNNGFQSSSYKYDFSNMKIYEASKVMTASDINSDGSLNISNGQITEIAYRPSSVINSTSPQMITWTAYPNVLTFENFNTEFGGKSIIVELPAKVNYVVLGNYSADYVTYAALPRINYIDDEGKEVVNYRNGNFTHGASTVTNNNPGFTKPLTVDKVITPASPQNVRNFLYTINSLNNYPLQDAKVKMDLSDTANNTKISKVTLNELDYRGRPARVLIEGVDYTVTFTNKEAEIKLIGDYATLTNQRINVQVDTTVTSKEKTQITLSSSLQTINGVPLNSTSTYTGDLQDGFQADAVIDIEQTATFDPDSGGSEGEGYNTVMKVSKVDQYGNPVSGAEFSLFNSDGTPALDANTNQALVGTTDTNGAIVWNDVLTGQYIIKETSVPNGYEAPDSLTNAGESISVMEIETAPTKNVYVYVNKMQTSPIVLNKTSSVDNAIKLAGATFEIYLLDAAGNITGSALTVDGKTVFTTDANGQIRLEDLAPGKYGLKEKTAPAGYEVSNDVYKVEVVGKTTEEKVVAVVNTATPYAIEITKTDLSNNPLAGAEFKILANDGTELETGLVTKANGKVTSTKTYAPGNYKVVETKAPAGYDLNTAEHAVNITVNGGTASVTVTNTPTPYAIEITKTDLSGSPLAGAEFKILASDGTELETGLVTAANGKVTSANTYAPGSYKVIETVAPAGYDLNTAEHAVSVTVNGGTASVTVTNTPTPYAIEIVKVDESGSPLAGAEFKILANDGTELESGLISGADGKVTSANKYAPGSYKVVETKAPAGYVLNTAEHAVNVAVNGGTASVSITNTPTPYTIEIVKTDESGKPLAGAEFKILANDGTELETGLVTKADGKVSSTKTYVPGDYKVVETKAPAGYDLNTAEHAISVVVNGGKASVNVTNTATPYAIEITKVDESGNPLADAEFKILANDGTELESSLISGADGKVTSANTYAPGSYKVVETAAPAGYELNTTEHTVTVTVNGGTVVVRVTNTATPYPIEILKVDEDDNPLADAEFKITDLDGNTLEDGLITDANGLVTSTNNYAPGSYKVVETKAPEGYELNEAEYPVLITVNGGKVTVKVTNSLILGDVRLLLTDDNTAAPSLLEGGTFRLEQVLDNQTGLIQPLATPGNAQIVTVKDGIITDVNGEHLATALLPGKYQFVQLSAPADYQYENDTHVFEVPFNCQEEILVHVVNTKTPTPELPVTGQSNDLYFVIGAGLLVVSVGILAKRKRA
ncbi:SpaA isopeptide-forming pilin-related protein [Culicoidibacter larvae]|nr:SpaA isopeptide-forming pilin-related protein [Culicoidibacter larvae]